RDAAGLVVACDHFLTDSSRAADVVCPVQGFPEVEGTVTNLEGRVQKVNRLVPGPGQTRPTWSVLDDLARRMGGDLGAATAEMLAKEIAKVGPAYHGVTWDSLDWGPGRAGLVLPIEEGVQHLEYIPVDGGLKAVHAKFGLHLARVLYDDGVRARMSPSLAALVPEAYVYLCEADAARLSLDVGAMATVESEYG
ncbi:MAG: molybdopterin-dependent oxidoreductase, partial [Actinomycetia bacterium]|nr:molybdopterin-dependent oxidoreductase [Actinomycetes bacterium]